MVGEACQVRRQQILGADRTEYRRKLLHAGGRVVLIVRRLILGDRFVIPAPRHAAARRATARSCAPAPRATRHALGRSRASKLTAVVARVALESGWAQVDLS